MFQLRRSMAVKNNAVVATCLRWFKTNGKVCPQYVKIESQKAYELHQNDLLVTGLTRALSEGKPSGRRGDMNVTTIRTEAIESLLQQAKGIEPKFNEAEELILAAETVLDIRRALLTDNMNRLQEIIDQLSYEEHISMDIIEEVAVARAEQARQEFEKIAKTGKDLAKLEESENKKQTELRKKLDVINQRPAVAKLLDEIRRLSELVTNSVTA